MQYWFGDVGEDGSCTPYKGDNNAFAERAVRIHTDMKTFTPLSVEDALKCGVAKDRQEYFGLLRNICINIAEKKIKVHYTSGDVELVQMVRMLDEMDHVINLLIERATEWYLVRDPKFSRKYKSLNAKKMIGIIKRDKTSLGRIGYEIDRLSSERTRLMKEISSRADIIAPNCSALVGGLVAARLISRAGSLMQISRMPGSTIQVLGAESALFTHLRGGTPSPKHGIIFQHRRIHNAKPSVRGKVARVLGGKLSIAAKLDYYRGEPVPEFIEKAQERIDYVFSLGEPVAEEKTDDKN
ncbi:NOP58 family protein [Methanoplanus sp. FWC-SCC4]|uniref:NOP58 family protein n=1 Tax=Methanochimaera problematica TaxID=2609417 RepID=A0AA97FEK8_9EURY|nr:NOP5/NOP56 family protein [Methanoplanus sp. FWC-SCC4]WOF16848.1 NOP58 family protein [Methanoplanus sp. FWC-SCC4]